MARRLLVSASALPALVPVYSTVLALALPRHASLDATCRLRTAFAVSDVYLGRCSRSGTLRLTELAALAADCRAGGLLLCQAPGGSADAEALAALVHTALGRSLPLALHAPSSVGWLASLRDSPVVDADEVAGWEADAGSLSAPGGGRAALSLQDFLERTAGGWSNTFG